ncbi:amino acid permease-domain-containing protein [Pyronema domesticum]|uniref:Similar to Large neutral amino acids transporter small subunit 1 acc. no. Q63016 n=1 Tax=Pyronema omphalodes (strain CBS 100304) TaxID=1076935 RepID=U4L777_PYROM|nr:amino acid permease-domain-containing protein [Pyronema domesticum]CCX13033.1 Similar to Large neutral amino acids transporter small subunit 1; acc. no. Q63016 [Pyronema omphalodes CBS 100304]
MTDRGTYAPVQAPIRDSLELASLADSDSEHSGRSSVSSSAGISSSRRLSLASDADAEEGTGLYRPRSNRSYSISSAFDFNTHLVPLTSSAEGRYQPLGAPTSSGAGAVGGLERQKTLTFLNGLSLLIGLQIGSGIFSSPSQVNNHVPSPGVALIVWGVAGLLAWTGAASYAELGGAIPLNGGSGVYLRHCFGELAGFLFSWTAVIVLKPGSTAIIAIISGEYLNRVLFGSFTADHNAKLPTAWANKLTAIILFSIVTMLNIISTRLTTRLSDGMMFMKVGTLLAITIIGIIVAVTGLNGDGKGASTEWKDIGWFEVHPTTQAVKEHSGIGGLGEYAIALYAGLWAFDGWDNVNYVTGEMRNAGRDLPRVIHSSMPIVIVSYLLANMSYYFVLPGSVIGSSNTVAVAFGTKVFGTVGGLVFAIVVSLSCFGALNATTFTSGRLVYAAGKEGYLPSLFGTLGFRPKADKLWFQKTPVYAMLLNALLTMGYILVGEFGTLLTFYGVAGYSFYFLTVLGLIVLRFREPKLERPYKTWITTPLVFCCVSLFLITRSVFSSPLQTLAVCAFVAAGVPIYYWRVRGWRPWKWSSWTFGRGQSS